MNAYSYNYLKAMCQSANFRCSQRKRGKKQYITISCNDAYERKMNWNWAKRLMITAFDHYYMTSGSLTTQTFRVFDSEGE